MTFPVSVAVPSIPSRALLLMRALDSVCAQHLPATAIHVAMDHDRLGAAATRDRALAAVDTEWVAFLDDDDEMYPTHLRALAMHQETTGADLVYPWFDVAGGTDPFPHWRGVPWDGANPHQVPVTFLARTAAIRDAGGFSYGWDPSQGEDPGTDPEGNRAGEDWRLMLRLVAAGAVIVHLNQRTWRWHHHDTNTSGLPSRVPDRRLAGC